MEIRRLYASGNREYISRDSPILVAIQDMTSIKCLDHGKKQQEPKLTAFVSADNRLVNTFKEGRDIYATIASIAYDMPYEECLEFNPVTHALQPDGKARRGEAKVLMLGRQNVYAPLAEALAF